MRGAGGDSHAGSSGEHCDLCGVDDGDCTRAVHCGWAAPQGNADRQPDLLVPVSLDGRDRGVPGGLLRPRPLPRRGALHGLPGLRDRMREALPVSGGLSESPAGPDHRCMTDSSGIIRAGDERLIVSPKTLIVEDEPDLLETCVRLLRQVGHSCLTARSGREAIALIDAEHPDLVVTDLRLPTLNGLAVTRHARSEER